MPAVTTEEEDFVSPPLQRHCINCFPVGFPCCAGHDTSSLWPDEPSTPPHKYAVSVGTVDNRPACPWLMRTVKVHVASLTAHVHLYKWFIPICTAERKKQGDCASYKFTLVQLVCRTSLKVPTGHCISFEILISA